ncbi:monocarboxylate transporter 9-like [Pecten maximus]|uniref:monocarboxylate transporter 9-like n=1 Tax=Pecten maximus TaxID=6579 RepID=UPI0014581340|nr:monocarboxylate transporter 9-like [Pecten maximus]
MTIGIFVSAFMTSLDWIIFTFGAVGGVGCGIQYTAIFVTIGYNFERNVNIASGFALSGVGVGTFTLTPVFAYLMTVYPLEGLFICLAGLSLQTVIFSVMFFPSSLEMKHRQNSSNGHNARQNKNTSEYSFCVVLLKLFKTIHFAVLLIGIGAGNFGIFIVYIHFANYAKHIGTNEIEIAFLLSVIGLGSCVSRSLAGLACNSKVIDEPTLLFGTYTLCGIFTTLLPIYSHTFTGQLVFAIAFGLYAGCLYGIMNGITLRYLPLSYLGTAVGIELTVAGFAIMTGPPAIGLIIDVTENYDLGLIIAGLCSLIGAILILVAESCYTTNKNNDLSDCNKDFIISLTEDVSSKLETKEEDGQRLKKDEIHSNKESAMMLVE